MSQEEKHKKQSEALILKWNEEYIKKNIQVALAHFQRAHKYHHTENSHNLVTCYFEKKEDDKCP